MNKQKKFDYDNEKNALRDIGLYLRWRFNQMEQKQFKLKYRWYKNMEP